MTKIENSSNKNEQKSIHDVKIRQNAIFNATLSFSKASKTKKVGNFVIL